MRHKSTFALHVAVSAALATAAASWLFSQTPAAVPTKAAPSGPEGAISRRSQP